MDTLQKNKKNETINSIEHIGNNEGINGKQKNIPSFWINDNRILLSILFGISGIIFFLLFMDSHYKSISIAKEAKLAAEKQTENIQQLVGDLKTYINNK